MKKKNGDATCHDTGPSGVLPAHQLEEQLRAAREELQAARELLVSSRQELGAVTLELHSSREQLRTTSALLENSQARFRSANHELTSINDKFEVANVELQAGNEELENSQVELLRLNNDLNLVNAELQRKLTELNQAKTDMENLFASSGVASIFLDRGLRIKGFTPAVAAVFNLISSDLDRPFRHLAGKIDWPSFTRDAETVLAGLPFAEREVATLDGERCFLKRLSPYRSQRGEIDGIVVSFIDITERKRMEEALRESERRYSALFANKINGVAHCRIITDGEGRPVDYRILEINEAYERIIGVRKADCEGRRVREVFPEIGNYAFDYIGSYGKVALEGGEIQFEEFFEATGQYLSIYAYSPLPGEFAAIFSDVTPRKVAEKALHEAHDDLELRVRERTEELAATVDTLRNEIEERRRVEVSLLRLHRLYAVLSETDQAIVRVSDRDSLFRDFCRIAVEQGGFRLAWVGMLEEGSGRVRQVAARGATGYLEQIRISALEEPEGAGPTGLSIRAGGLCFCNDYQNDPSTAPWHDQGRAFGIRAAASVAIKEEGRVIGTLTLYAGEKDYFDEQHAELVRQMGADVSFALDNLAREARRQKAEQALHAETLARLEAVEQLRQKERMLLQQNRLAAMGEMINNIAHQWRQPLNVLGLMLQQMQLFYEMDSFGAEYLNTSVAKSMGLINHMSQTIDDFRGFFKPDKEKTAFAVHEVVARTLSLIEDGFKYQQIGIGLHASAQPEIFGFPNEYSQVLLNILMNARDALLERHPEAPLVTLTISREAGKAVVTISDNAGGIPEEILEKVFEPYFTTKGPDKGTGVGLFMSKIIIENNMGGSLTVRNSAEGAEFKVVV
jgi:signal transduction histidine kinase/PAS domain-containing protein